VEKVPRPKDPLLALDEQLALPGNHEERLLPRLGVVETRLARLQDGDVDAELREQEGRRVTGRVFALERTSRTPPPRRPPLGVPHIHDEPAVGDGCKA